MIATTDFGDRIAERMGAEHEALATRWFERLIDLLPVDERNVFPSNSLLDHVPALIREISSSIRHDDAGAIAANTSILDKARELGALRHQQRASLHQVLREYQILGGVLVQFVLEEVERLTILPLAQDCVFVVSRIHQAVDVLSQTTVETFVSLYTRTISEQTERLQQFTRMATHEWRQPLGAVQFGVSVLQQTGVSDRARRTLDVVERNVAHLVDLTRKLEAVARLHGSAGDTAMTQTVSLGTLAREAARQLRDMAELRGVDVRIAEVTPEISIDVGRLELTLVNLFSNAIKYCDPSKPERYVELTGSADADGCRIVVRDNGIGIPKRAIGAIFQRFTRAHAAGDSATTVDGVGLGLSIVDDCVRSMGGRIDVESVEGDGAAFVLVLPSAGAGALAPSLGLDPDQAPGDDAQVS
jgi:signal transduction histidine kinase